MFIATQEEGTRGKDQSLMPNYLVYNAREFQAGQKSAETMWASAHIRKRHTRSTLLSRFKCERQDRDSLGCL